MRHTHTGIQQVLALLNDQPVSDAVLTLAVALAKRHGAAASALLAMDSAVNGLYMAPEVAAVALPYAEQTDHDRRQAGASRTALAAKRGGIKLPFAATDGDALAGAVAAARCSDLVVLAQHAAGDGSPARLHTGLLVQSGVPLLFVPDGPLPVDADGAPRCGQRVLVAWAPTREATRALHDALPLLAAAEQVDLLRLVSSSDDLADDPLPAVCDHLSRHGIAARPHSVVLPIGTRGIGSGWTPDVPIGEALLSHAADTDADLIVMGGYGHARAWEWLLGGVTRTLLGSMTVPVLMSH